jgi:hypothetical protein
MNDNAEIKRLNEAREQGVPWKKWGPYLSERQWGTVREDYSDNGDAWNYFSHDQARSRAYRWGEDRLGGISDDHQVLCMDRCGDEPRWARGNVRRGGRLLLQYFETSRRKRPSAQSALYGGTPPPVRSDSGRRIAAKACF